MFRILPVAHSRRGYYVPETNKMFGLNSSSYAKYTSFVPAVTKAFQAVLFFTYNESGADSADCGDNTRQWYIVCQLVLTRHS